MKRIFFLFLLFLFTATFYAQVSPFFIKGKTDTFLPYFVLSRESKNGIVIIQDTIKILADKTFNQTIKIDKPVKGFLVCGGKTYQLWLIPGSSLAIDLKDGNAMFSGNAGIFAKYYIEDNDFWSKTYKDYKKKYPNFDEGANSFSDNYFLIQDSITNQRLNFLKKYFTHANVNDKQAFIKQESMSFIYSNLYFKTMFEGSKVEKFKFYQDKQKINSPNFYGFSDMVKFKNGEALSNSYFREFTISFVRNLTDQRRNESGQKFVFDSYLDSAMTSIDELVEGIDAANEMKVVFLNFYAEVIERENKIVWADKINSTSSSLKLKNKSGSALLVKEKLDKFREDTWFQKRNPAPDFTLIDLAGNNYTLKDFKGKKVYIDLGASWCGPCIKSIPSWNKLVEENKNNTNVIFIALSLDDTEEKWRKYTEKYQVKGLQLYAGNGGFKSGFAVNYDVKSLPQYILIDNEGKIEKVSAPGPDSIEIKEKLL
ncbi:TlpA family protein disulfide reductase [Flavobacterium sp. ZB4P13]|uniref:TlpA family protein disulfide reductase n=1 Tax=Flavobacterium sp. ZB4P13 TaxID=3401728 RepID=UPI003AB0CD74